LAQAASTLLLALAIGSPALAQTKGAPGPNVAKPVAPQPATSVGPQPLAPGPQAPGAQPGVAGPQPAGAQPAKPTTLPPAPPNAPGHDGTTSDELVNLPAFAEPVQLSTLIELVARTLNVNIATQGEVPGTVVFNAPVPVKKSELIGLLDALLEQQQYTITRDRFGLYTVSPSGTVQPKVGDEFTTTRVFRTPNMRPSALKLAIEGQLGPPTPPHQNAFIDEIGVVVATDTPRRLNAIGDIIQRVSEEASKATFTRIELKFLAAPIARDRALQLVGQISQRTTTPGQPNQPNVQTQPGGPLDNIGDRLTVDAQGNALIFRGLPDEVSQVQTVIRVIDVPNNLQPKSYFAGSAASQIANIARQRGLGEVTTISDGSTTQGGFDSTTVRQPNAATLGAAQTGQQLIGGPVMVVNESTGIIIYYGTADQQAQLDALVKQLDTQAEKVIIGVYKLKNSDAEDVAGVIQNLISSTTPVGTSSLLPGGGQPQGGQRFNRGQQRFGQNQPQPGAPRPPSGGGGGGGELTLDSNGFVIADKANNQILVKAPTGQQPEFARLIEKLDLRRPQVYIEAKIVAVNWTNDFRLAFETQLINAGGAGGLINTNFGLSSFGTNGVITGPKTVATTLGGLTGAVVKADMVPIIVNALQTKANARVLSVPQVLVNDNEEAEIASVDTQPTSSISRVAGQADVVTSGPSDEAGTKLKVKPHISEGGYLSLKYDIELSSFTGAQTTTTSGTLPSPKQVNTIGSDAVTVPSDATVIVGGLEFDSNRLTRAQVPLLGDIPLIGLLFQDRTSNDRTTTLYVFLTPKILRDPTFADLRLITAGPQAHMKLATDMPPLRTASIDINRPPPPAMQPVEPAPVAPTTPPSPAPAPIPLPTENPAPASPGVVPGSSSPAQPPQDDQPPHETKAREPGKPGPSNDDHR
jgi:general secretion pathway protein D